MEQLSFQTVYPTLTIFDVETTGLDYQQDKIIEFGFITMKYSKDTGKYELVEEGNLLVKVDKPLSEDIVRITNITDLMLEEEGVDRVKLGELLSIVIENSSLLMGYNLQFDLSFVQEELRLYKEDDNFVITTPVLDLLTITRDRKEYPHKLFQCLEYWGVDGENSHRALDDTKATYALFKALMLEEFNPQVYVNRFGVYKSLNGFKFPHIKYVKQSLNGTNDIEKSFVKDKPE